MSSRAKALRVLLAGVVSACGGAPQPLASPVSPQPGDSVRVSPPRTYEAWWLHRVLLGDLNRDLWRLPVDAEVLDLGAFAGGLTPTERGGGAQTPSLRFTTGDGREVRFRSLDKDVSQGLDPELSRTIVADVLQDQVASLFPLSALVVSPLLDAARVLHADPRLVLMPDDARLGEFREGFAGRLGWMEEQPNEGSDGAPGFAGSGRVTGSDEFLSRLEESPDSRIDAPAFLRARLMDLYVGDWDRHPDQWRWAAFEDGEGLRWEPVPRDRDWALNHIDGLVMGLSHSRWIQFVSFGYDYESIFGAVWNGRALDRRLLSELTRRDFEVAALELQGLLTDGVIQGAVGRLPSTYPEEVRTSLEEALVHRRDELLVAALEYYSILSGWVDIWATDEPEYARVERLDGGDVRVTLTRLAADGGGQRPPHFDRVFLPAETSEVRVFLRGGGDSLVVSGEPERPIKIRVIGGGGADVLADLTSGRDVRFYDDAGENVFTLADRTLLDESEYEEPDDLESATHRARPRDWGTRWYTFPLVLADSDIGLSAGQTWEWQEYGFRFFPYRNRFQFVYAINAIRPGARVTAAWEFPIGRSGFAGTADFSGVSRDVRWFYGVGNETPDSANTGFFRADRGAASLAAGIRYRPVERVTFGLAPIVWHSWAVDRAEPTFIEASRPASLDAVTQGGLGLFADLDFRDSRVVARRGGRLRLDARFVPELFDATDAYATVRGEASFNVALGAPVLSVRAGGARLFGEAPYFEWPQLGGADELRGFVEGRFTGESIVFGGAQLRTRLTDFIAEFPGTLGVNALIDAGRAFADGEESSLVHVGYGGGVWVSLVRSDLLMNVTGVRSREATRFYLTLGFPY